MATRTRIIPDNEIQSQLDKFTMEDGFEFFKSLSGEPVRVIEDKVREKLPDSGQGLGWISKKVTKFIGRKDQESIFISF